MTMASRDFFDEGKSLCLGGQFDVAERMFREAINRRTDDEDVDLEEVQYWWARSLHRQKRHDEAESIVLQNFSSVSSPYLLVDINWLHADIKFEQNRFDEAEKLYWSAVSLAVEVDSRYFEEFDDVAVFAVMLECFYLTSNHEKAEQVLLHLNFDDESIAELLVEIAEPHTSVNYSGRHIQIPFDSCTQCLQFSIRLNPLARTFSLLGRHLQVGDRPAEAVAVYQQMESLLPDDFDEDSARSYGWALQSLGSLVEAEHWLRKSALEYFPDDLYEVEPLITFYGQYQRWSDAREIIESYISAAMFKSGPGFEFNGSWAWSLHAACCEFMGDVERTAISQLQVNVLREKELRDEITKGRQLDLNHYGLGVYLKFSGRLDEAETSFCIAEQMFVAITQEESEQRRWFGHYRLGLLHEARGDLEKAEAQFRESLLIKPTNDFGSHALGLGRVLFKRGIFEESEKLLRVAFDWISFGAEERYWLGRCLLARGRTFEAEKLLAGVAHDYPFSSEYAEALEECRLALELAKTPAREIDFRTFLDAGEFWLKPARWLFLHFLWPSKRKRLLEKLSANGSEWADSSYVLFTDFEVTDDDLDDTLARAVAVSRQIHLAPEMPVNLRTEKLNVLLDLEGQLLRAWVGKDQVGLVVTVDISTWAIYYAAGNRDAMFATGVAINWFLDCSIALASHPKFRRLAPSESSGVNALSNDANNWTTQSQFESDIEQILTGRLPAPPKAHRVSGHIRRLGEGSPSDAARENAPPYIRRHMSPDETWVRGHNRGGDTTGMQLLTRLQSYSSLADFLATAQRARPSRLS